MFSRILSPSLFELESLLVILGRHSAKKMSILNFDLFIYLFSFSYSFSNNVKRYHYGPASSAIFLFFYDEQENCLSQT